MGYSTIYVTQPDDTLVSISSRFRNSVEIIKALNWVVKDLDPQADLPNQMPLNIYILEPDEIVVMDGYGNIQVRNTQQWPHWEQISGISLAEHVVDFREGQYVILNPATGEDISFDLENLYEA